MNTSISKALTHVRLAEGDVVRTAKRLSRIDKAKSPSSFDSVYAELIRYKGDLAQAKARLSALNV